MPVTTHTYQRLEEAYNHFNDELFEGELGPCMITLQRRRGAKGYYGPEWFRSRVEEGETVDEIALNPDEFTDRDDEGILSTLVHEMVHKYQREVGKPSRNGYHNRQWADLMIEVGLIPSSTGEEGGKQTGQSMTHYIEEGGVFQRVCRTLLERGSIIDWETLKINGKGRSRKRYKTTYVCPVCLAKVWGKPNMTIICGDCAEMFESEEV